MDADGRGCLTRKPGAGSTGEFVGLAVSAAEDGEGLQDFFHGDGGQLLFKRALHIGRRQRAVCFRTSASEVKRVLGKIFGVYRELTF